jgi:DNA-binding transcriptional ArsR family regulator
MAGHHCCPKDLGTKARLDGRLKEELQAIPREDDFRKSSRILHALGHVLRLKIALLLLKRGHCVCEIVQLTGKRQNVVSYHLKMMRRSEIVNSGIEAGWKYYTLTDKASEMLRGLVDLRNVHHSQDTPTPAR